MRLGTFSNSLAVKDLIYFGNGGSEGDVLLIYQGIILDYYEIKTTSPQNMYKQVMESSENGTVASVPEYLRTY